MKVPFRFRLLGYSYRVRGYIARVKRFLKRASPEGRNEARQLAEWKKNRGWDGYVGIGGKRRRL